MRSFIGIFGAIVFIFGLLGLLFMGSPTTFPIVGLHLVVGVLAVLFWLFNSGLQGLGDASSAMLGRKARFGYSAGIYILILVALLGAFNWIVYKNNRRFDLTLEGVYSLSPQSKSVIDNLKKPLKLVAFKGQEADNDELIKSLLDLYRYVNPEKVSYEIVDPKTKPHLVEKYEMKAGNLLYLQLGEDQEKSVSRINELSEQALTNAVIKLSRGASKKIYFVEGHGEPSLKAENADGIKALAQAIGDENLTAEAIFLGEKNEIPEDASAVLLVSPKRNIPQAEKDLLVKYANAGGRLLLFSDPDMPGAQPVNDIKELASGFGITIGNDVVVDLVQRLFGPMVLGAEIVARDYGSHPVTRGFGADSVTIFNLASSVSAPSNKPEDPAAPSYQALVSSGKNSWAERSLDKLFDPEKPSADFLPSEDLKGPVPVAVAYEKKLSDKKTDQQGASFDQVSRVIVFGDSDFIRNQSLASYANRDLILNSINWMVGEEGGLEIRARSIKASVAPLTRQQLMGILSSGLVLPELLLLFGLFVWWRRKALSK